MPPADRKLADLSGIGKAMLADFALLQIRSVDDLASADPDRLFTDLCKLTNSRQDPCVLDTFRCAVAQARNPRLPKEQRNWWYWSRQRKAGKI
jgi:nucleotidyltransferase/DNA polymerase involved in DNA repair